MKSLLLFLSFILSTFALQSQNIEGTYANTWVSDTGEGIEYTLTLQTDGEFTFIYKRMYIDVVEPTEIKVNGNWTLQNHLLTLETDEVTDEGISIASKLDMNQAKFISMSPRNPNFNLVRPSLKFYKSDVFYANNMELIKTEASVTSSK